MVIPFLHVNGSHFMIGALWQGYKKQQEIYLLFHNILHNYKVLWGIKQHYLVKCTQ